MSDFNLDEFIPYQISVLAKQMSRDLELRYRQKFGIRVSEWRILAHLSQAGPVSVRELEKRVDMHKSRVSRAAGRLKEAGLITNSVNMHDRRLRDLQLTAKGRRLMEELAPLASRFQLELLDRLGHEGDGFRNGVSLLLNSK